MITENDHGTTNLEHNHIHNFVVYTCIHPWLNQPGSYRFWVPAIYKINFKNNIESRISKIILSRQQLKKECSFTASTDILWLRSDYSTSLNTLRIGRSSFTILFFWKSGTVELFKSFMCQIKILYSPASSLRRMLVFQSWQQFPPHVAFSLDSSSIQHQAFWGWMQNIQFVYESKSESEGLLFFLSESTGDECKIFYFSETFKSDAEKARASPYWRLFPWICGLCENGFSKHLNLFRDAHIGVGLEP